MSAKNKNNNPQREPRHKYVFSLCIENFARGFTGRINNSCDCIAQIRILLEKDHIRGRNPFTKEVALDLDKLETIRVKGISSKCHTVDYIVGLESDWILYVEAKLDADKPDHFAKDLRDKWNHSRELKSLSDYNVKEEKTFAVLLKDDKFEQNKDRLRNMANGLPNIKPMKVSDFYCEYFDKSETT